MASARIFEDALQEFKSKLDEKQKKEFRVVTSKDVEYVGSKLQEELKQSKSYRALGLLQPFIEGVSGYATVIEVFAQTSEILCFVWGPTKFLLQVTSKWHVALEKLMDALAAVGEKLLVFEHCSELARIDTRFRYILVRVYKDILDLLWAAMRTFRRNTVAQVLEANSPLFDRKLRLILSNLDRDEEFVHKAISAVNFEEAFKFHHKAEAEFKKAEKQRTNDVIQMLQQDLIPQFTSAKRLDAARKLIQNCPNAGSWLLNHQAVLDWTDWAVNGSNIIALLGIPGAGKTTLSSIVFNTLDDAASNTSCKYHLLHLAITFQQGGNNNSETALRSMLYDQLTQSPEDAVAIFESLGARHAQKMQSTQLVEKLSQELFQLNGRTFLFIDGLDEINNDGEIREFLKFLDKLFQNCLDLRIFLSCRAEDQIEAKLKGWKAVKVRITEALSAKDMHAYVQHPDNIDDLVRARYTEDQAKRYLEAVTTKAEGMFLYARLILLDLDDQLCQNDIGKLISELPKGLDEAYERALKRILNHPEKLRKAAIRVFKFLLATPCTMRVAELEQAIMTEPKMEIFMPGRKPIRTLTSLCGSLIEIDTDNTVSLVHSSLGAYLLREDRVLYIRPSNTHLVVSRLCLEYLQLETLRLSDDKAYKTAVMDGEFAFLTYSCRNLPFHLQYLTTLSEADISIQSNLIQLLEELSGLKEGGHTENSNSLSDDALGEPITHLESYNNKSQDTDLQARTSSSSRVVEFPKSLCSEEMSTRIATVLYRLISRLNSTLRVISHKSLDGLRENLSEVYGPLLRCRDTTCSRFFEGYIGIDDFAKHVQSHNKTFKCEVSTCPFHHIGFGSASELDRHSKSSHDTRNKPGNEKTDFSDNLTHEFRNRAKTKQVDDKFKIHLFKDALSRKDMELALEVCEMILEDPNGIHQMGLVNVEFDVLRNISYGLPKMFTPVHTHEWLFFHGNLALLKKIYGEKLDRNAGKYINSGCLAIAILGGNFEVVKYLVSVSPKLLQSTECIIQTCGVRGDSYMGLLFGSPRGVRQFVIPVPVTFWAALTGNEQILEYLIDKGSPEYTIDYSNTLQRGFHKKMPVSPFLLAALSNNRNLVDEFIAVTPDWESGLLGELVSLLVTIVANPNARNRILEMCKHLSRQGAPFWKIELGVVLGRCSGQWIYSKKPDLAEITLSGVRECLELGAMPIGLKDIWNYFDNMVAAARRRHVVADAIKPLVEPLITSGIRYSSTIEISKPFYAGEWLISEWSGDFEFETLFKKTESARESAWRTYRELLFSYWLKRLELNSFTEEIHNHQGFHRYFCTSSESPSSTSELVSMYHTWKDSE